MLLGWVFLGLILAASAWASPGREVAPAGGQPTFVEFKRHKRNYLISGTPNTKGQLSFRVPVVRDTGHYLAYSQSLIWELFTESSSPVTDVNFNPEYFYRFRLGERGPLREFDLGVEHRSNGGKYEESRGWNDVFVDLPFMHQLAGGGEVFVSFKPFWIFGKDENNPDVHEWIGWYEFEVAGRGFLRQWLDYDEVYLQLRPGGKEGGRFSKGGLEVGLRFKVFPGESSPHAFIQWFSGYGESQLRYRQETHALRAGFSI
jgi:phospholipase A1